MNTIHLEKLGYTPDFWNEHSVDIPEGFSVARITEVNKNSYKVTFGVDDIPAELSGKFLFIAEHAEDYPTVGDWVVIQLLDDDSLAVIHTLLPRKTVLKRKEAGKRVDYQLIGANIDYGFIMQAANNVNLNLLERYTVMLHECAITPVVIFTKADLLSEDEKEQIRCDMERLHCSWHVISNKEEHGIAPVESLLEPGTTYCLLGPSGVGKTTLLNRLTDGVTYEVGTIREKDGRGRHTTVRRQLIRLGSGSIIIDTPGMRELGNFAITQGVSKTFDEFTRLSKECRYNDCTHTSEEGCAIIAAVGEGDIEEEQYRNYLKLRKESAFYAMSYQEKRKKDKSFGKMVKNYKKIKRT